MFGVIKQSSGIAEITKSRCAIYIAKHRRKHFYKLGEQHGQTRNTQKILRLRFLSRGTGDEAHCISQWGQDFRPSYLKIVEFIRQLKKRQILSAFTATATENVKEFTGGVREKMYFGD